MFKKTLLILALMVGLFIGLTGCTPTVETEPVMTDIEVTIPQQTDYEIGSDIDYSTFVIQKLFDDGTKTIIPSAEIAITGYDATRLGEQTLTITYGEYTKTISIRVIPALEVNTRELFDSYLEQLFVRYLRGDAFSINYLLQNPEALGLDQEEAKLPRISQDDYDDWMEEISDDLDTLYTFNYQSLSKSQQLTYDIMEASMISTLRYEPYYYLANGFLGSFLGYQAQLPILLAEYRFDDLGDIENYFDMIEDISLAFENYFAFEVERSNLGYGMADFIIDKVITQCNNMLASMSDPYLVRNFNEKVNGLSFLTETKRNELKAQNQTLIQTHFFGGYQYLKDQLPALKGKQSNNAGLSYLEEGQAYYQILFEDTTGIDIDVPDAFAYLEGKATEFFVQYSTLSSNTSILREYSSLRFSLLSGSGMVDYHEEMLANRFPLLSNEITYVIKSVDSSMQDNFSPAAYFLSPIDANVTEIMYLNPKHTINSNYVYMTLAHEGYPGHLYQHVYFKSETDAPYIRHLLSFSGYDEGWATYVEHRSLEYAFGTERAKELYLAEKNMNAALTAIIDIGIHYYGWKVEDVGQYLNTKFGFNSSGYQALFEQLVEIPTNVQKYYFTYFTFMDMLDATKTELGELFNEVEFHKVLLDTGPAPFNIIQRELNQYIALKKTA